MTTVGLFPLPLYVLPPSQSQPCPPGQGLHCEGVDPLLELQPLLERGQHQRTLTLITCNAISGYGGLAGWWGVVPAQAGLTSGLPSHQSGYAGGTQSLDRSRRIPLGSRALQALRAQAGHVLA